MINPSKTGEYLNSPTERASEINDPQFQNNKGYFSYDLTHSEYISPRFGEITPSCHLDVVPADRIIVSDNTKLIRNQIQGNLLSTINQYQDSFFVSFRSVFPQNYEKLIPNPTHGDDLPNSALPQVPLLGMLYDYLFVGDYHIYDDGDTVESISMSGISTSVIDDDDFNSLTEYEQSILLGRLFTVSTVLSRGQLLDYLGYNIDFPTTTFKDAVSKYQYIIDQWFSELYVYMNDVRESTEEQVGYLTCVNLNLNKDGMEVSDIHNSYTVRSFTDKFEWRSAFADCLERGQFPWIVLSPDADNSGLVSATRELLSYLRSVVLAGTQVETAGMPEEHLQDIDALAEPFESGLTMNIGKILGYQQIVAQYYTNNNIDNVFSSDLFMENLRSVMFPCDFTDYETGIVREPVFQFNGRSVEYDYISYGGFYTSLLSTRYGGTANRQHVWMTLMLLLRRSLRYGDYFSTARPHMLAISDQLGINVENGMVSPVDVTKNLLLQRFLNAANYISAGFLQFYASMFGVKPSDTGVIPRFISHKKITVNNQITNNTSENQGFQTTNLVALGEKQAMDVFCDDFGYLYTLCSFDTLPVYDRGVDANYHLADRFDYYNPMLENIGDQPIRLDELTGNPRLHDEVFGWTMRNANYKFKLSKTHGAFVNELKGNLIHYPFKSYIGEDGMVNIDPDYIRDKPIYLDRILDSSTGESPANYYHFIIACVNEIKAARKITATPSILF